MWDQADLYYIIKIWLISIVGGPITIPFMAYFESGYGVGEPVQMKFYLLYFFIGGIYSVPAMVILYLIYYYLVLRRISFVMIKTILALLGFIFFVVTFSAIGYPIFDIENIYNWAIPISYSLFFLSGVIVLKIRNKPKSAT